MTTSNDSLDVPGASTASPNRKHQLRQRSPRGQRGRPRKVVRAPPRNRLRELRAQTWFVPAVAAVAVLVLALLFSAIRISLHTSDYVPPVSLRPSPATSSSPARPSSTPRSASPGTSGAAPPKAQGDKVEQLHDHLDEAVRHALEEAWALPPRHEGDNVGGAADAVAPAGEGADAAAEAPVRQRTLAELYADLEELGISPHELGEALSEGMKGSDEWR